MKTGYKYKLEVGSAKHICPNCNKKRFVLYIDTDTGDHLPEKYGRCDRESKCAYHNIPPQQTKAFFVEVENLETYSVKAYKIIQSKKTFFIPKAVVLDVLDNGVYVAEYFFKDAENSKPKYNAYDAKYFDNNGNTSIIPEKALNQAVKPEKRYFIPSEVLQETLTGYNLNRFINNILENVAFPFDVKDVEEVISLYYLGTSKNGATSFPFIDIGGKIRAIQEKVFDKTNRTDKTLKYHTTWIHSRLKATVYRNKDLPQWLINYDKNETKVSCLFGEHLLTKYPNKPIALVEAPKTAIYGALYFGLPDQKESPFLWLAVYNLSSLTFDKCKVLRGRKVILFPDLSKDGEAFDLWSEKALEFNKKLSGTKFIVSDLLEKLAPKKDREQGNDIADLLIKQDWRQFRNSNDNELRKRIEQEENKIKKNREKYKSVKDEIRKIEGNIDWQKNRSRQFKTIIERGY